MRERERERGGSDVRIAHILCVFVIFPLVNEEKKNSLILSMFVTSACVRDIEIRRSLNAEKKTPLRRTGSKDVLTLYTQIDLCFFALGVLLCSACFFYLSHKNKGEFIKTSKWKKKLSKQNAIYSDFVIIIFASGPCVVGILWWCFES